MSEETNAPDSPAPAEESAPVAETKAPETPKPENPIDALRDQALALVSDENKSQLAALIKSIIEHKPAAHAPVSEPAPESERVAARYEVAPFRPRITREVKRFDASKYGSISGD